MEQEILVKVASGLLQILGLVILASLLVSPSGDRGFCRERLLLATICGLGIVTIFAGLKQLDCSLSCGLTISLLTVGAIARVGLDVRHSSQAPVYY